MTTLDCALPMAVRLECRVQKYAWGNIGDGSLVKQFMPAVAAPEAITAASPEVLPRETNPFWRDKLV
jgi:hypothetical protein